MNENITPEMRAAIEMAMATNRAKYARLMDECYKLDPLELAGFIASLITTVAASHKLDSTSYAVWFYTVQREIFRHSPAIPGIITEMESTPLNDNGGQKNG